MEDRENMEGETKQLNGWFSLHVLHALHGKKNRQKKIHQQAPVLPARDSYVYQGEENMEIETVQMNGWFSPSCSSCASW